MNERIKQLATQAGIYQLDRFDAIDGSNQMEKFADSLIWECMKICEDVMKKDNSALACWSEIKGTFRS